MGVGQISDVYVVTHGGSIGRGIVRAKQLQRPIRTESSLNGEWDQVCFWIVILSNLAFGVRASCIKVAERKASNPVRPAKPEKRLLDGKLGFTVRACGSKACRFFNGHPSGYSVHGAA